VESFLEKEVLRAITEASNIVSAYYAAGNPVANITPILPPSEPSLGIATASAFIGDIGRKKNSDIEIYRFSAYPEDTLVGYFKKNQQPDGSFKVRLAYSSQLNLCWSRLIVCKEAMHLLLGTKGNETNSLAEIDSLITKLLDPLADAPNHNVEALLVERTAIIGAIELLIPYEKQVDIRDYFEQGCSCLQIAESFKIPEQAVVSRYSQKTQEAFNKAYLEMGKPPIFIRNRAR
jgi:hypothetical protein